MYHLKFIKIHTGMNKDFVKSKIHINKKLNLAYTRLSKLYPLLNKKSSMNIKIGTLIYKSILRPIFLYACPVWGTATQSAITNFKFFKTKFSEQY